MVTGVEEREGKPEERVLRVRAGIDSRLDEVHTLCVLSLPRSGETRCAEMWQANVQSSPLPHRMFVGANRP